MLEKDGSDFLRGKNTQRGPSGGCSCTPRPPDSTQSGHFGHRWGTPAGCTVSLQMLLLKSLFALCRFHGANWATSLLQLNSHLHFFILSRWWLQPTVAIASNEFIQAPHSLLPSSLKAWTCWLSFTHCWIARAAKFRGIFVAVRRDKPWDTPRRVWDLCT